MIPYNLNHSRYVKRCHQNLTSFWKLRAIEKIIPNWSNWYANNSSLLLGLNFKHVLKLFFYIYYLKIFTDSSAAFEWIYFALKHSIKALNTSEREQCMYKQDVGIIVLDKREICLFLNFFKAFNLFSS